MKTNPLVALGQAGQSPWLDYIHRGMIASGELARRIAEDGIRGVTSNPTIFEKAVSSGHDYDAQIRALARGGAKLLEAYKAIVTDDIRAAADVLRPVYDASRGTTGTSRSRSIRTWRATRRRRSPGRGSCSTPSAGRT